MNTALLRVFHALPAPAQSVAASLHGLRLRSWRYGPESERLVAEALERDTWSASRWDAWRAERLGRLLERAATRVPYYRAHWSARRQRGDRAAWDLLEHWPILEKKELRAAPRAFVADDCDIRRMYHEHTSGTTGTPIDLWWSRATVRAWYAQLEARCRRWHGVSREDRWAILGGQPIVPAARARPPYWVWNAGMRQLYLSSYHLSAATAAGYLDAMARHRIRHLVAYPSALDALARAALEGGHHAAPVAVAVTNAEPLLAAQRERISAVFGCPVRETYGMAEIVAAASECPQGRLHLWPDTGVTEVFESGRFREDGAAGALVCTGLINADMPLIRYRIGDRGSLGGVGCPCGRSLPMLASVEGRNDDMLRTRDGRRIGRLDPVFKASLRIQEAQVVQETLDRVRVRLVPAAGFGPADREAIAGGLRLRLGDVHIVFEELAVIPRTSNGKLRAVVSQLPEDPA